MSIYETIRKEAEASDADPADLAADIVAKVTKADLVPLVEAEIRSTRRHTARGQERKAFREAFNASKEKPARVIPEGLRSLFATPFALGDGTEVNWLLATSDQHRERIAKLSKLRDGLDRTISQHREAVTLIEEAGVSCLADLTEGTMRQAA